MERGRRRIKRIATTENNAASTEMLSKLLNDIDKTVLVRSFLTAKTAKTLTLRFNDVMEKNRKYECVIISMSLLPALKWMVDCEEINSLTMLSTKADSHNSKIARIEAAQKMILEVSGNPQPLLKLQRRQEYFRSCKALCNVFTSLREKIADSSNKAEKFCVQLLDMCLLNTLDAPSEYTINNNIDSAIDIIYNEINEKIKPIIKRLLTNNSTVKDKESALLYHNASRLMREYRKITLNSKYSNDKAVKLLSCRNGDEMLKLTENDSKYEQAYIIAEFTKMIHGAITKIREFGADGEVYYKILIDMEKEDETETGNQNQIKQRYGISERQYYVKKKRALYLLGSLLWGSDADSMLYLLTD